MAKKGTLLPKWLQTNTGTIGVQNYKKLEERNDYAGVPEWLQNNDGKIGLKNYTTPAPIEKPIEKPRNSYAEYANFRNTEISKRPIAQLPPKPLSGYDKFKAENPDTPNFLKPLGYALETPYRNKFTQRLLTKTGNFLGAKSLDQKGNEIKPMSTGNKIVDGGIDVGGAIIGSGFTGPSGSNLLTGTDKIAQYGGIKVAETVSKLGGNKKLVNTIGNTIGTYSRGAIDAGASTAIEGIAKGRDLKETAKNTAINSVFGGTMFVGGKVIGDTVKGIKSLPTAQQNAFKTKFGEMPNINTDKVLNPKGLKGNFNKPNIEPQIETPSYLKPQETPLKVNNANGKLKPQIIQMKNDTLPLKNRDIFNVGNKKVNAYQYDNPTVKPYMAEEARIMKGEIERGSSPISAKTNNIKVPGGSNDAVETLGYGNIPSVRSETTSELNKLGTYKEIDKALDDIIHDKGRENYALAKKVELTLDERMTKGYREDVLGHEIPPNSEYLQEKAFIDGMPQSINTSTINKSQLQAKLKPQATIKPPSANTPINTKLPTTKPLEPFNTKVSEFKTNTLTNSEFLADAETQKVIKSIATEYEVKPNVQTMNRAVAELTNDFDGVMNRIKNTEVVSGQGALQSAEDSASSALITRQLRMKAKETGDYTELKSWLEVLQPKVTNTAQSLQAIKTWKDLSPEGTIFKAQQVVGKVNREGEKLYGKNFKPIELTTDEIKVIGDSMEDVMKMPETTPAQIKAKEREFAKVKKIIGDKVPATLADKVKALQRISLLLNPKTNVRNVLGNTILGTLENTKDIISAPLDKLVSLKTGQRTTLLPSLKGIQTQGKGLAKGVKTVIGDAKLGVNTSLSRGQFEISGDRIFKSNTLNKLDNATNTALRLGDEPFYQAAYDESLRQQLKIAKLDKPTKEMLEKAKLFAEDRTLQNTSAMSEGFKKLQQGLNKMTSGSEDIGLGTFAVPFVKTPANILDKAIDYSPVGSIKAISQLISSKTFNQKLFVDRVGRSIVGTGGIMLGYKLAKEGAITGATNKDKDVAALDRQMGKSPYAFKNGDTYRTFDWAAPASIMLAIGADMYQEGKTNKDVGTVSVKAMTSGAGTLFKQSLLQGFQRLFGYNDLAGGLIETAMNAPTQFVPTVLKQSSQLKDSSLKDTYDPNRFKKLGNQIKAKLPIISESLPNKIDTLGRDMKQFQGKNNAFNVLVNPSFTTKNVGNATEKFVSKLYEETGLKTHFPKVAEKTITYKVDSETNKTINLTADEKVALQRYIGRRTNKEFQVIAKEYEKANSNQRTQLSAKQQIKDLGKLLTDIYTEGEKKILEARGIQEYQKGTFGKNIGNNPRN